MKSISLKFTTLALLMFFALGTVVVLGDEGRQGDNAIEVTVQFVIPPLDLRGYDLCHFEAQQWFWTE